MKNRTTKSSILFTPLVGVALLAASAPTPADWTDARCDVYPPGEDKASAMIPCTFNQRQGAVTITRSDGVTHDLVPTGDAPGQYTDQDGNPATREDGLGSAGLIFRLKDESVFVYWSTAALEPADADNPTAPYSTADYDATTLLRCGSADGSQTGTCPAGVLRMEDNQGSVVITSLAGEELTINFMTGYVNSGAGEVEANLEGDTWIVIVNGRDRYEVPVAAIEGG